MASSFREELSTIRWLRRSPCRCRRHQTCSLALSVPRLWLGMALDQYVFREFELDQFAVLFLFFRGLASGVVQGLRGNWDYFLNTRPRSCFVIRCVEPFHGFSFSVQRAPHLRQTFSPSSLRYTCVEAHSGHCIFGFGLAVIAMPHTYTRTRTRLSR